MESSLPAAPHSCSILLPHLNLRLLACSFVAEDGGDPSTVSERLVTRALEMEAAAAHLDLAQLKALPPGRRRRQLHDDLTAVVIRLGSGSTARAATRSSPGGNGTGSDSAGTGGGFWSGLGGWFGRKA